MFEFFHPQNNPGDLTGLVGGNITTQRLTGYLGEVFTHVESPPTGIDMTGTQYRLVYVRNTSTTPLVDCRVWLEDLEHPEQISLTTGASTLTANATTEPATIGTWESPTSYQQGFSIGNLGAGASQGIWLRQQLSSITEPDPYATFRLVVGGVE